ncbi:MAG: hypothetical protein A2Z47_01005, partial [Thermodesulfovibrio sp. RBG_19FT_COMBO_42_12]
MPKDPVCGMDVDPAHAAGTSNYKGETIYFCNPHCKERFDAAPDSFMTKASAVGTDLKSVPAARGPVPIGMGSADMAAPAGVSPHESA